MYIVHCEIQTLRLLNINEDQCRYTLLTGNSSDGAVFTRINFRLSHVEDLAAYTAF